ncbi:MAG: glycosyltransferase family 39 protein [Candidatus Levyibacteriota bacterium]
MLLSPIKKHRVLISFLVVLFSALFFRVTHLDLIEFKTDEAVNLLLAAWPLLGHGFVSGGTVSSLGILNPPIFNYILFPAVLISYDPRLVSLFVSLINVVAILGFFLLLKKYYGLTVAIVASLLLSFSPWAILYSRKIWMQDLLMPFSILFLFSIHKIIMEKSEKYWILYAASSLVLVQLHPVSAVFILITSVFMLKKTRLNLKYAIYGILIGILPLIPYAAYEIQNGCPNCSAFLQSRNKLSPEFSIQTFMRPFQILGVGDFRFILGDDTLTFAEKFPFAYKAREVLYSEYLMLPFGILIYIIKNKQLSFLGTAVILTTILYFFLKIETFMHYYIILMPLLFLFLASAFSYFLRSKNFFVKMGALLLLTAILASSVSFNRAFFELLRINGGTSGDYGAAYISSDKEARVRLDRYKNEPNFQERLLTSYIPLSYMYGYMPLSKTLYGDVLSHDIPTLENDLREDPQDKKTQFKLLSFYTKTPETTRTIYILREKNKHIPEYLPIYTEVLQRYMSQNLKKFYSSSRFTFFYPEHWILTEEADGTIELKGDGYNIYIKNLGQNDMTVSCVDIENKCNENVISELKNSTYPL